MTNEEAREILKRVEIAKPIKFEDYADMRETLDMAIKALEKISHLIARPCEMCEFYTEDGCSKWECVFEEDKK